MAVIGASPWSILGLAATSDRAAIRRAYAGRLKVTNPEDDPEGFQRLREAYERALAFAVRQGAAAPAEGRAQASPSVAPIPNAPPPAAAERDAGPAPAPPPFAAPVGEAELDQLRAELARLQALIEASPPDPGAVVAAFTRALKAPALDAVALRDQVEAWIASTIAAAAPRADVLIDPAVLAFGWDDARVRGRAPWVEPVLKRRDARDLLARLARSHRDAFKALQKSLTVTDAWRYRLTPGLLAKVEALLRAANPRQLGGAVNEAALAWWMGRLRNRVSWRACALALLLTVVAELTLVPAQGPLAGAAATAWPIGLLLTFAAPLAAWWATTRGRALIGRRWPEDRPRWLRFGWIGAAVAGLALASAASAIALFPAIVTVELVAIVWALALSPPQALPRRVFPFKVYSIDLKLSGSGLVALCCLPLVLYGAALARDIPQPGAALAFVALIGAIAAFGPGFADLLRAWRGVAPGAARLRPLIALTLVAAVTPLGLWAIGPSTPLVAPAAVLVELLMFAHLVVAPQRIGLKVRNIISRLGWIPCVYGGMWIGERTGQGAPVLLGGGAWILAIAACGLIGAIREERLAQFERAA